MENMDLDKMMQQLLSGAMSGQPGQEGEAGMPDLSQFANLLGQMGQEFETKQSEEG